MLTNMFNSPSTSDVTKITWALCYPQHMRRICDLARSMKNNTILLNNKLYCTPILQQVRQNNGEVPLHIFSPYIYTR